jgi:hypothetical protein
MLCRTLFIVMVNIFKLSGKYAKCLYAKCLYAEFHYSEYPYDECRYTECRYTECHHANVIMPSDGNTSVVAP